MKKKIYLSKKQILIGAFLTAIAVAIIMCIFIKNNQKDTASLSSKGEPYIVTEYFTENNDKASKIYEVRYYTRQKKSYLTLVEENGVKKDKRVVEVKTEFTSEYTDFTIGSGADSKTLDLSKYADDSGFVYKCRADEIKEYLKNEAQNGKIRFTYATPSYYECYIEKKTGNVMRGLILHNSDVKTETLIYKECKKDIIIPVPSDYVTAVVNGEKQ
jgi:hypothetical protein